MDKKKIAKRLISARGAKTREEVAFNLNLSVSSIQMYENGERVPRDEIKIKMSRYYGIPVGVLFFGE